MIAAKTIQKTYQILGERISGLPKPVIGTEMTHWRTPSMSPIGVFNSAIQPRHLLAIESYFRHRPKKHPFDMACPYFINIRKTGERPHPSILKTLKNEGWVNEGFYKYLNLFTRLRPLQLGSHYQVLTGSYENVRLRKRFLKLSGESFNQSTGPFLKEIHHSVKEIKSSQIVLIETLTGKTVAAGMVMDDGECAYLFSGSVDSKFRRRGLWRALLAARMAVSASRGAKTWLYSSSTTAIESKGDAVYRMEAWIKRD